MATIKVEGFKELDTLLAQLPKATAGNVLKRALLKAAAPIRSAAQHLAPDDSKTSGLDDLHVAIVALPTKNSRTIFRRSVTIAPAQPLLRNAKSGKITGRRAAAFKFEYGDSNFPAHPFMRPAWEQGRDKALVDIKYELSAEIQKALARLAKKGL